MEVTIRRVEEAEVDEMWSFVGKKKNPRWLWHAIDHHTGAVLAYAFGRREDEVFLMLNLRFLESLYARMACVQTAFGDRNTQPRKAQYAED